MLDFVPSHHRSIQVVVYLVSGHMAGLVDGLCILDAVEGFAGEAAITKSLRSHCLLAVAYDYKYDAVLQNILNPYGYVFLLSLVLRLGPLGVMWLAVVCSSWVWVSRSSTKRSFVKPMGEESHASVKQSNVMVSRATILIYICEALSLLWFLEQPSRKSEASRFFFSRRLHWEN